MRAYALCPEITTTGKMALMFPSGPPPNPHRRHISAKERLKALRRPFAIDIKRYATAARSRRRNDVHPTTQQQTPRCKITSPARIGPMCVLLITHLSSFDTRLLALASAPGEISCVACGRHVEGKSHQNWSQRTSL